MDHPFRRAGGRGHPVHDSSLRAGRARVDCAVRSAVLSGLCSCRLLEPAVFGTALDRYALSFGASVRWFISVARCGPCGVAHGILHGNARGASCAACDLSTGGSLRHARLSHVPGVLLPERTGSSRTSHSRCVSCRGRPGQRWAVALLRRAACRGMRGHGCRLRPIAEGGGGSPAAGNGAFRCGHRQAAVHFPRDSEDPQVPYLSEVRRA